jgi:DNA mismatch repair ATPase MutL
MSTHSKNSLRENIIEIYGLSAINSMKPFTQCEPNDDILIDFKLIKPPPTFDSKSKSNQLDRSDSETTDSQNSLSSAIPHSEAATKKVNYSDIFKIEGYISNCAHGSGRSAPDRQYLYINKRPLDNSRMTKLINEVFHQFNRNQYPMYILNVKLEGQNVDVNVTPDKLQMFIRNESGLLALIKASLLKMYEESFGEINIKNTSLNDSTTQSAASAKLMTSFFTPRMSQSQVTTIRNLNKSPNEDKVSNEDDSIDQFKN